jgi:hypothetical protein
LLFCAADKKNQEIQGIKDGMIIQKGAKMRLPSERVLYKIMVFLLFFYVLLGILFDTNYG